MATAAQIQQEIIDFYNSEVREYNEKYKDRGYGVADEADSFTEAFRGYDIEGAYEAIAHTEGVKLASGLAKQVERTENLDGEITVVFSVGDQYFQIEGTYSSWDGHTWEDKLTEVEGREVTVIKFFKKD